MVDGFTVAHVPYGSPLSGSRAAQCLTCGQSKGCRGWRGHEFRFLNHQRNQRWNRLPRSYTPMPKDMNMRLCTKLLRTFSDQGSPGAVRHPLIRYRIIDCLLKFWLLILAPDASTIYEIYFMQTETEKPALSWRHSPTSLPGQAILCAAIHLQPFAIRCCIHMYSP